MSVANWNDTGSDDQDHDRVIRAGQVLCHGSRDEVLADPEARKCYFGEDMDLGLPETRRST